MKFIAVTPDEIPNMREAHRGRVSYPILKSFLETNMTMAQIDREGIQQTLFALSSTLGAYIRNHNLPIKLFIRKGEIYLVRTDVDEAGNIIATPEVADAAPESSLKPIDAAEVGRRFEREKGQVTK